MRGGIQQLGLMRAEVSQARAHPGIERYLCETVGSFTDVSEINGGRCSSD